MKSFCVHVSLLSTKNKVASCDSELFHTWVAYKSSLLCHVQLPTYSHLARSWKKISKMLRYFALILCFFPYVKAILNAITFVVLKDCVETNLVWL